MVEPDGRAPESVWCRGDRLDALTLHALLKLRVDVFVVEQQCAYAEIDGRDLLATTWHGYIAGGDGAVVATVRLLAGESPMRIGRVVTRPDHRGASLSERLVQQAHDRTDDAGSVLDAQTYLVAWYQRLGWRACGAEFIEDGIPHTPMRRALADDLNL